MALCGRPGTPRQASSGTACVVTRRWRVGQIAGCTGLSAAGSRKNLTDPFGVGRYFATVSDPATHAVLFSKAYDSYFGEFLEDYREDDPLLEMNRDLLKARIAGVLEHLDYREREIIRLRYGLADGYSYTLEEVGNIFSVTRERVRQIETKAVRSLQHPIRARQLSGFVDQGVAAALAAMEGADNPAAAVETA